MTFVRSLYTIRRPAIDLFGARLAYLLWLLPAICMLLPVLPTSWSIPSIAGVLENSPRVSAQAASESIPPPSTGPVFDVVDGLIML